MSGKKRITSLVVFTVVCCSLMLAGGSFKANGRMMNVKFESAPKIVAVRGDGIIDPEPEWIIRPVDIFNDKINPVSGFESKIVASGDGIIDPEPEWIIRPVDIFNDEINPVSGFESKIVASGDGIIDPEPEYIAPRC